MKYQTTFSKTTEKAKFKRQQLKRIISINIKSLFQKSLKKEIKTLVFEKFEELIRSYDIEGKLTKNSKIRFWLDLKEQVKK